MVQFIGNSIHFNGKGILDGKLVLPNRSGVIGNGSLFKAFLPFSAGTFANASDRYITAKNPTTGLYEITGPFGSNVLATKNIGGDTYGQFFRQVTEDITYTSMIEDYSMAYWGNFDASVTTDQINSPIGTLKADLLTAINTGSITHYKRANTVANIANQPNVHGGFFKNNNAGGVRITAHLYGNPSNHTGVDFSFSTGLFTPIGSGLDDYGALELADGWWFIWIVYHSTVDQAVYRYNYILDASLNTNYEQAGESFYWWGGTDELNASYPSFLKLAIGTYIPDYFYFPSSAIPTWMKSKFTMKLIPNYDIPYTTEDKPIWSFNKTAATLTTGYGQHGMAVDSSYLYWANLGAGKIQRIPIGGGTATDHVTGLTNPWGVQVNATDLFWSDITAGKIQKCPVGGGSVTDVVTGLSAPYGLAITATEIFWADRTTGKIQKCPIGGGSVTDIATGLTNLTGLAVDSNYIYYAEGGSSIKRIPVAGGTAITLASSQSNIQLVHADDWFVYWGNLTNDKLQVVSKQGGAVITLIDLNNAYGCTTLDGALFYSSSDAGGTIARRDSVTAWLTTTGTVKVVEGPTTMIETSAATASMHQNVQIEFDRVNGKITLSGFTSGDGEYTDTAWTSPDGFDVQYGCALGGAAQSDALVSYPKG